MSKKNEYILYSDHNSDSFSSKSDNDQQKDIDLETEEEQKNRLSLQKALESNNNTRAFEKINQNISSFCSNIQVIQDYSLCLGSKQDNKEKAEEIEKIIIETADKIAETFNLIEIIKNYEYKDRDIKIQNITKANRLEDECNKYKKIYDDLTDKIKKQNLNLIKQARTSVRYSNFSDFSGEIHLNDEQPINNVEFQNGKEFLEGIEVKRKQNNAITKATRRIERRLSKKSALIMNLKAHNENNKDDDENKMEIFNIEENSKKNDLQKNLISNNNRESGEKSNLEENKYMNMNNFSNRTSKMFHEMEDKVFMALEGQRQNFIRRHWIIFLIILILIIGLVYYIFFTKNNSD